jgi:nicotinate dehydrogenase subunit B
MKHSTTSVATAAGTGTTFTPSRRSFIKAGSLTVAFSLSSLLPSAAQTPATTPAATPPAPAKPVLPGSLNGNRMLDGWLRINPNGTVTMFTGKVELGQGILTALSQIVSDELDVDIKRLQVISGDTSLTPNEGVTAGSLSVQDSGTALRYACAEARGLLLQAAASKLGVGLSDIRVIDGGISAASGARTSYWEVAGEVPLKREVSGQTAPKSSKEHRLIGQSLPRRDIPAKVTGGEAYVQDMRLPGMLFGRVVMPSAPRAKLTSVDEAAARAMPGVVAVVRDGNFLAVAAQREEQAIAAATALKASARWSEPGDLPPAGAAIFAHMKRQPSIDTVVSEKTVASPTPPAKTLKAEYTKPYQAHASIGPSCAVALWTGDKVQVWTHSQSVFPLRADLVKTLGLPPANITVSHREGSGCYGHNAADDVALDAALVARAVPGKPVKLQWMREDEFAWEPLGSAMVINMAASLDTQGRVQDWTHELWSYTHNTRPGDAAGVNLLSARHLQTPQPIGPARNIPQPSGSSDRNAVPLYAFPQQKITNHLLQDMPIRTSALRTLGAYANVFAAESFMDEMAALAGTDPVEFRLKHLTDARARAVIERTAAMASWKPKPTGSQPKTTDAVLKGRGIAFSMYKNLAVYCAVIVDVAVDTRSGIVTVERAWSANDAGLVINPDGLRNQIEGGIIQSASWTLYESVAHNAQQTLTRNWADYPILRFPQVPALQVEIINRPDERPLGVGEGSQGPTVAAIANAFANATGRRLRDLPLTPDRVKKVLA